MSAPKLEGSVCYFSSSSSYSSPVPLKNVLAHSWEQKYREYFLTTHFSQVSLKQTTHLCSRNAFGSVLHLTQTAITEIQYIKGSADRYSFDCGLRASRFGESHNHRSRYSNYRTRRFVKLEVASPQSRKNHNATFGRNPTLCGPLRPLRFSGHGGNRPQRTRRNAEETCQKNKKL